MERIAVGVVLSLLVLEIVGCGGDDPVGTKDPPVMIEAGLSGDTYINTKFGVKVENIPTEGWTVKALGKDGQGLLESGEQYYIPMYHLLLMEPVPENEFVNLDVSQSLNPVIDAEIPCIWIALDYWEGGEYETHDLTENLESYAALHGAEIESKKMIGTGKNTGIQAVLIRSFGKEAITWFAKGELCVRCEYIATESEFHVGFITYQQISQSITLMGK